MPRLFFSVRRWDRVTLTLRELSKESVQFGPVLPARGRPVNAARARLDLMRADFDKTVVSHRRVTVVVEPSLVPRVAHIRFDRDIRDAVPTGIVDEFLRDRRERRVIALKTIQTLPQS